MKTCVFAGTFDPFTTGHKQIVDKALSAYEKVVVVLAVNSQKTPLFSTEERMDFIKKTFIKTPEVSVDFYDGFMMDYMKKNGYTDYVRGVRGDADLEYENFMKENNKKLNPAVKTVFIECDTDFMGVSSSLVREKLFLGEPIDGLVPKNCKKEVENAFRKRAERSGKKV